MFLFLLIQLFSSAAVAEDGFAVNPWIDTHYEISLTGGMVTLSSSSSAYSIAPSVYIKPLRTDLIQVGGEVGYQSATHQGTNANSMTFLAGVAINLGQLGNAFFCKLGVAAKTGGSTLDDDPSVSDPDGFGYHFICGKRIQLGNGIHWSLKPSMGVISGGTSGIVFRPLAISFLF